MVLHVLQKDLIKNTKNERGTEPKGVSKHEIVISNIRQNLMRTKKKRKDEIDISNKGSIPDCTIVFKPEHLTLTSVCTVVRSNVTSPFSICLTRIWVN